MPVLTFDIDTYTVLTNQSGTGTAGAWRTLSFTSTALSHGIRNRATIYFFESTGSTGVVTNVDQPNFNGLNVYAYAHKADFPDWYDLTRNEAPLKFTCAYSGPDFDPNQSYRQLHWFQLFTGQPEPPGEGPEQLQAMLFPAEVLRSLDDEAGKGS